MNQDNAPRPYPDDLALVLSSARAVLWRCTVQPLQFLYVSPQAEALFGVPIQAWYDDASTWANFIHPEDRERAVSYCAACAAKGEDHSFEYRVLRPDGMTLWIEDTVTMIQGPQGPEMVGVMVDITARREAERRRDEERRRSRLMLNSFFEAGHEAS
jgi:PAS domain S-box-containing protein